MDIVVSWQESVIFGTKKIDHRRIRNEKEVAEAASLCYYLPHEDKCKRGKNTPCN